MMFPSQNKLDYQTGTIGNDTLTALTSGGVSGELNIPKDLSLINRRGYASTNRKGVPWVYRCEFTLYRQDEDGVGVGTAVGGDFATTLKIDGCQNNWVMKNAAVKWHAAREAMFRDAGIKKGSRGSYSHEIRYNYDSASDTWLVPVDGDGNAFTGGTWDVSSLAYTNDNAFALVLVGAGDDEEADAFSGTHLSIGHSYLVSRLNQQADTNLETEEGPADFSVLRRMLADSGGGATASQDDVVSSARDEQDNPPYEVLDLSASGDTAHDITEPVELGRAVCGIGSNQGSVICDVPFGLAKVRAKHHDAADTNVTHGGLMCVKVLDIYPMQG